MPAPSLSKFSFPITVRKFTRCYMQKITTLFCTAWILPVHVYYNLAPNSPSSPLSRKLPGEVIRLLNMNGRREGAVYIPFNFCVLLSRWLNMIVLAVMSLIRGYFPSARLTVELCCSSGVHTAAGHHLLISSSHSNLKNNVHLSQPSLFYRLVFCLFLAAIFYLFDH